jgi:hypothetical protein
MLQGKEWLEAFSRKLAEKSDKAVESVITQSGSRLFWILKK